MKLKNYIRDIILLASLGLCLNFLRNPFAAADADNYISFFEGYSMFLEGLEPGLVLVRGAFSLLPFNLSPLLQYLMSCLIPLMIITLISSASRSIIPIIFYLSSEVFVMLSFNGMRQGISTALLISGVFVFTTIKNKYKSTIGGSLLLLLSILTHRATAAIVTITALACILLSIRDRIVLLFRLKARKISRKHLITSVTLAILVAFFFPYIQANFLNAFFSYRESTNVTSETGILGPLWRVAYSLTLFHLVSRYTDIPNIKLFSKAFKVCGIIILVLVLAGFGIGANRLTYQLPFMGTLLLALTSHNYSTQPVSTQAKINNRDLNRYSLYLSILIFIVTYTSKSVQLQLV